MAKETNKTIIGLFVVGAIALLVLAVLILGGGNFFKKTTKVVMFFDGSIKGLNVGSPVMFRGVEIGSVVDIKLIVYAKDLSLRIPVIAELDQDSWVFDEGKIDQNISRDLIKRGLKAQLQTQSFVTGQLLIALDFFPEKPIQYTGLMKDYLEIPVVPTTLQELSKTVQDLPLKDIIRKLDLTLEGISKLVYAPETMESIVAMKNTLQETELLIKDTRTVVSEVDKNLDPLVTKLNTTTEVVNSALFQAKNAISILEKRTDMITNEFNEIMDAMQQTMSAADATLGTFDEDSHLYYEVNKVLEELSSTARSVKVLAEYLERHPESLLKGKAEPGGD